MDGDLAPLGQLAASAQRHDAVLIVDDAHGFGILGQGGRGIADHYSLGSHELPLLIGTLGKAFGTAGAFVAGSRILIDYLIQFARTYIYTTAMPPAIAAASLVSLQLSETEDWRRQHLRQLIKQFRAEAQALGYTLMPSETAIQPILIGDSRQAMRLSAALQARGIAISAIRPPTVPEGSARLRVTLSAGHSEDDLARLIEALAAERPLLAGARTETGARNE
jgi:8-amino-7-oxononanoate synthase